MNSPITLWLVFIMFPLIAVFFICVSPDRADRKEWKLNKIYSEMSFDEIGYAYYRMTGFTRFNYHRIGTLLRKYNSTLFYSKL